MQNEEDVPFYSFKGILLPSFDIRHSTFDIRYSKRGRRPQP
jgi:hypothetical protein